MAKIKTACGTKSNSNYTFGSGSSGGGGNSETLLQAILDELRNDDNYQDTLWEAPDGTVVIRRVVRMDDGSIITEFITPDGAQYSGNVSQLLPYSRHTIVTQTDYCANGVPFTLLQFRDNDTKQVVATIWRNDNTLSESVTAPSGAVKGLCETIAATVAENKSYQILNGQSITFNAGSVYLWQAGVFAGSVNYTEGGNTIGAYTQGDSFGNGFANGTQVNTTPITITTDLQGDCRISVMQTVGYIPTII